MNFWIFRKQIANFRTFDYNYNFDLFIKSLELTSKDFNKRKIIVDHAETAESIDKFCKLYKRYIDDNYMEEAGCNWDNVKLRFVPLKDDESLSELEWDRTYTDEEMKEFREKGEEQRQKEFVEMIEAFKQFETWWD